MGRLGIALVVAVLAGSGPGAGPVASAPERPAYRPSRVQDVVETLHGTEVHDPYRWLEDGKSPEVQQWAKDQSTFARQQLDGLPGRDRLEKRVRDVSYVDAVGVPQRAGSRLFFTRRKADQEKAVLSWRGDDDGVDHVLVDPNALSKDGSTTLGEWVPSHDGKTLAYALRENNADEATLYVKDVASGKVSERDRIAGAKYASPSWTPAGDGFYYTWVRTDPEVPTAERPGRAEIRYHALGTDPAEDTVIRPATGDPEKFVGTDLSRDGHWLLAYVISYTHTEIHYRDQRRPDAPWTTLVAGVPAHFRVNVWDDRFYVSTDDGASRWRVLRVDPAKPARADWTEIVPEAPDAVLEDTSIVGGRLALSWLEAGGGYAVANLRGGGEYGEDWHKAGSLAHKQNVFDDFIAAGEYLVKEGWTKPERLAIQGGSNGGLLVGAVLTQRPDLFKAVICAVPLLDMVRYHRFGSGRTWVSEYGSADNKDDFGWLYAYSPYHHVKSGTAYPAVLMASSDSDDRVDPLHARKMAALLQAASTGGPVLLRIEANAGHGGAGQVSSAVAEGVDFYSFLFDQLGMKPPPA